MGMSVLGGPPCMAGSSALLQAWAVRRLVVVSQEAEQGGAVPVLWVAFWFIEHQLASRARLTHEHLLLLLLVSEPKELCLNFLLQVESGGQDLASLLISTGVHLEVFLQAPGRQKTETLPS